MGLGKTISIWMTEEEEKKVKKKAAKDKRSVSNYIRLKIFEDKDE